MSYATAVELSAWVGDSQTVPAGGEPDRLLERASTLIDQVLLGAVYDVDPAGGPTGADVAQALSDATCAQVEHWLESGDELGASGSWDQVSIGSVRLSRGTSGSSGGTSFPTVAPRALRRLHLAGLLPGGTVLTGHRP